MASQPWRRSRNWPPRSGPNACCSSAPPRSPGRTDCLPGWPWISARFPSASSPTSPLIRRAKAASPAPRGRGRPADLLVAIGGGSAIDATQVMQLALWGGVETTEALGAYRAGPGPDRIDVTKLTIGVRMIAVPTTLSAAESTPFAGVTDMARKSKEGYAHPLLAPRAVVLDPAATPDHPAPALGLHGHEGGGSRGRAALQSPALALRRRPGRGGAGRGWREARRRPAAPDDLDARLDRPDWHVVGHGRRQFRPRSHASATPLATLWAGPSVCPTASPPASPCRPS